MNYKYLLCLMLLPLVTASCGGSLVDPFGQEDDRRVFNAALYFDHAERTVFCPGADERLVITPAAQGQPPEQLDAWCSWSCARYEPDFPHAGQVVLMLDVSGETFVQFWDGCG